MTFEELFNLAFLAPDPGPEWRRLVEEAREGVCARKTEGPAQIDGKVFRPRGDGIWNERPSAQRPAKRAAEVADPPIRQPDPETSTTAGNVNHEAGTSDFSSHEEGSETGKAEPAGVGSRGDPPAGPRTDGPGSSTTEKRRGKAGVRGAGRPTLSPCVLAQGAVGWQAHGTD